MSDVLGVIQAQSLCRSCAKNIWNKVEPTPAYAERAARLLFMTAAHESKFIHRRQLGGLAQGVGAYGLWQTEWPSIQDSLMYLQKNPAIYQRSTDWLQRGPCTGVSLQPQEKAMILRVLQEPAGDRLSCLLARLHYMRVTPKPIPEDDIAQAKYAKLYYNTIYGSAKVINYLEAFRRYWPEDGEL